MTNTDDDNNRIVLYRDMDFKKAESLIIKPQNNFTVFSAR